MSKSISVKIEVNTRTILAIDHHSWYDLDGCSICTITEDDYNKLVGGTKSVGQITPLSEISLKICGDVDRTNRVTES